MGNYSNKKNALSNEGTGGRGPIRMKITGPLGPETNDASVESARRQRAHVLGRPTSLFGPPGQFTCKLSIQN
jgi:hypothetical protein